VFALSTKLPPEQKVVEPTVDIVAVGADVKETEIALDVAVQLPPVEITTVYEPVANAV
jgi:hypothetical protein